MAEGGKNRPTKQRRLTRIEKADENRKALFRAAAKVVGRFGYAGASVSRITELAGLAQGTFYVYFESRQSLLDQLLPAVGHEMLDHLSKAVHGVRDIFELEEQGFRAFFEYLARNQAFFRVLSEAEAMAPIAWHAHFRALTKGYIAAMKRAADLQQITGYTEPELEIVVFLLMGAREYIYFKLRSDHRPMNPVPDDIVEVYMRFIRHGLQAGTPPPNPASRIRPTAPTQVHEDAHRPKSRRKRK